MEELKIDNNDDNEDFFDAIGQQDENLETF